MKYLNVLIILIHLLDMEYLYKMLREPVADAEKLHEHGQALQMNSQLMKKKESQFRRYL